MKQTDTARARVASALIDAARAFPDITPSPLEVRGIDPRDTALAVALHRCVLQRWRTLEYIVDRFSRKPCKALEPAMRSVMLCGAAQLLFFDRLPAHAVVDETVTLARKLVRRQAAGMANAVLRKVAQLVAGHEHDVTWTPAADALPTESGMVRLTDAVLPAPGDVINHVAVATGHPHRLCERWARAFGRDAMRNVSFHGLLTPPTIVALAPDEPTPDADDAIEPHAIDGFAVWRGDHEQLVAFLDAVPGRRVQDPAAARALARVAAEQPTTVVDFCAGRGTKTRQAAQLFPNAAVIATDTDLDRFAALRRVCNGLANARAVAPADLGQTCPRGTADLLVLDVPCSNTGVLARRPEAKYRFRGSSLDELIELQRHIVLQAAPLLAPGGTLLYTTCSIEAEENQEQVAWMAGQLGASVEHVEQVMPEGRGTTYHDGSYHAVLRMPKS